ncbi:hypothetical protein E2C01_088574 [Portunus trituberculatus]|uniref:Uncharacterized protein n=1 Tax=Portunus trituberculatus TaxID=210409 RepID=A0A5B7JJR8_PORTR|nr:hypothetical protein [Portunus trituberculatus]
MWSSFKTSVTSPPGHVALDCCFVYVLCAFLPSLRPAERFPRVQKGPLKTPGE